jgi:4-amino-4-deoxy-L-arabinose transferase-like glycosyltransferase
MNARSGHPWRWLAVAALVGLIARLVFGLVFWTHRPLTRDEAEYLSLARSLSAGQGYGYDAVIKAGPVDPFGRAPGYPAFLALVGGGRAVVDAVPASVKIVQAFAGALGVLMIGMVGCQIGGRAMGATAAMLAALFPPLVWISGYAWSEALFWPIGLAAVWAVNAAFNQAGRRSIVAAIIGGGLMGVGALVRAGTVLAIGVTGLWLLWRRRWLPAVALGLAAAIVILPWTARNVRHYGRLVLIATDGGVTFWTGNNALATGEGDMATHPDLKLAARAIAATYPALSEEQLEPVYYREALAWIGAHPAAWLSLELRKAFYVVVPMGQSYRSHSTLYAATAIACWLLLLPAAIAGALAMGPVRRRAWGVWLLGGTAVLTMLIFFPQERFAIPVIDPALILCASALARPGRTPSDA